MPTSIEAKLYQAASVNAGLLALLGGSPPNFRWSDTQEIPGSPYPAVVVHKISNPKLYSLGGPTTSGRNPRSQVRVQFTIWEGYTPDTSASVETAIYAFLDTFSATATGFPDNQIVNVTDGLYAETQPSVYQTMIDVMIRNDDNT
jgi:hypothetical protein